MKNQVQSPRGIFWWIGGSLAIHVLILVGGFLWISPPLEVVHSDLEPAPIRVVSVPVEITEPIPTAQAEVADSTPQNKPKPVQPKSEPVKTASTKEAADTVKDASLFDTDGDCPACLRQPVNPDPEHFASIGLDTLWADVLVKLDERGAVIEVGSDPRIEEGLRVIGDPKAGDQEEDQYLLHPDVIDGALLWNAAREVALIPDAWNFHRAARHVNPKITQAELLRKYPPGKWIRQRVHFRNIGSK